jgi:nicotinate dehydrogenase subunit B
MQDCGIAIMNAAAQVREIQITAAAARLQLAPQQLTAGDDAIIADDGRRLGYGELVSDEIRHVRAQPRSDLLDPGHYRHVGASFRVRCSRRTIATMGGKRYEP